VEKSNLFLMMIACNSACQQKRFSQSSQNMIFRKKLGKMAKIDATHTPKKAVYRVIWRPANPENSMKAFTVAYLSE